MVVKRDGRPLKSPTRAVAEKQDPGYREADFLRDLKQVSQRRDELPRRSLSAAGAVPRPMARRGSNIRLPGHSRRIA